MGLEATAAPRPKGTDAAAPRAAMERACALRTAGLDPNGAHDLVRGRVRVKS